MARCRTILAKRFVGPVVVEHLTKAIEQRLLPALKRDDDQARWCVEPPGGVH